MSAVTAYTPVPIHEAVMIPAPCTSLGSSLMARDATRCTASSLHAVDRGPQPPSEHVVGELGLRPAPRRRAHLAPASRRRRTARSSPPATAVGSRGSRTTTPVSPSTTASSAPPLAPATCGTPAAAASRNTMPKPSCSSPPQRLRHTIANTSAQPYSCGRSSSGTRPRKRTAPARSCARDALEPASIAARPPIATVRSGCSADAAAPQPGSRRRSPCAARAGSRRPRARRRRAARTAAARPCARRP